MRSWKNFSTFNWYNSITVWHYECAKLAAWITNVRKWIDLLTAALIDFHFSPPAFPTFIYDIKPRRNQLCSEPTIKGGNAYEITPSKAYSWYSLHIRIFLFKRLPEFFTAVAYMIICWLHHATIDMPLNLEFIMKNEAYRNTKKALGGLLGLLGSFLAFLSFLAFRLSSFNVAFLFPIFLKTRETDMIHH